MGEYSPFSEGRGGARIADGITWPSAIRELDFPGLSGSEDKKFRAGKEGGRRGLGDG